MAMMCELDAYVHARKVGSGGMGPSGDPQNDGKSRRYSNCRDFTTMGIPTRSHTARSDASCINIRLPDDLPPRAGFILPENLVVAGVKIRRWCHYRRQ